MSDDCIDFSGYLRKQRREKEVEDLDDLLGRLKENDIQEAKKLLEENGYLVKKIN